MTQLNWEKIYAKGSDGCTYDTVRLSQKPITNGWAFYVDAECAVGFDADESVVLLPAVSDPRRYVAIYNHSPYWCRPFWGGSLCELPARVQELLLQTDDGYACFLPLCDSVLKTVISGGADGMRLVMHSNCQGIKAFQGQAAFLYMEGSDPMTLLRDCAQEAIKILDNGLQMRKDKTCAPVFDHLGWCSWDSMHVHVNHNGLLEKAREFSEKGVPVRFAIIDDMWADVPPLNTIPSDVSYGDHMFRVMKASPLTDFAGDPVRFPMGMAETVKALKQEGIPHVGIWFPTTGYWKGIDPNGPEFARQEGRLTQLDDGMWIVSPDAVAAEGFFDDLCARASEWGGDFVKIDNQGCHGYYRDMATIGQSARALQGAIDKAAQKHFDGALINCMGMPSECMFNRVSTVCRCSDDFIPENREWFSKNILQCSFNGLLQGQYYVNDWDMWWTDDAQAVKNSLCRAISGGPIYISDKIGRTNPEILKPICLSNGRILRCDESATPTADCLMCDPTTQKAPFKIRNRIGETGVVAAFHIYAEDTPVCGKVCPEDAGLASGDYVYYEYFTGACGLLSRGESLPISFPTQDGVALYWFVPHQKGSITPLGRLDLFMGVGAIESNTAEHITFLEGGKLGFAVDCEAQNGGVALRVLETEATEHLSFLREQLKKELA